MQSNDTRSGLAGRTRMRLLAGAAMLGLVAGFSLVQPAAAQEVTLRAVTFLRLDIDESRTFKEWVEAVNKDGKGLVQVRIVGGQEVMNGFELGNAVKSGVIDIAQVPPAYHQGLFPGAQAFVAAGKSPVEQRKNGALDYLNELYHQMVGSHILLSWGYGIPFHLYLGKNVSLDKVRRADLSGLKLRTVPIYKPMFDSLGATSVSIAMSELYTAMERGTTDGYGYIANELKGQGWHQVTRYRVDPGFYNTVALIMMNWAKLQSLSEKQRSYLIRKSAEIEATYQQSTPAETARQYVLQKAHGLEVVTLEGDAAKKFSTTARETAWADVKQKMPAQYERLRKLLE